MDSRSFIARVRRLHPTQGVAIKFVESTGMVGLSRLFAQTQSNPNVRFDMRSEILVSAVLGTISWGGNANRAYEVYGLSEADDSFLAQLARDVESVEVGDHGAKALMSGRQKMREEAVLKLKAEILTPEFLAEIEAWDVVVDCSVTEPFLEGIAVLAFRVLYDGETLTSVTIDGWSGRLAIDGMFDDQRYIYPKQVQKLLLDGTVAMLEKLTAA